MPLSRPVKRPPSRLYTWSERDDTYMHIYICAYLESVCTMFKKELLGCDNGVAVALPCFLKHDKQLADLCTRQERSMEQQREREGGGERVCEDLAVHPFPRCACKAWLERLCLHTRSLVRPRAYVTQIVLTS